MPLMKKKPIPLFAPIGGNRNFVGLNQEQMKRAHAMASRTLGWRAAEAREKRDRTYSPRGEEMDIRREAEQEKKQMREKKLGKMLERFPEEAKEELMQLMEQATEQNISALEMHKVLQNWFHKRFPRTEPRLAQRWIKTLMNTTHPDYAQRMVA